MPFGTVSLLCVACGVWLYVSCIWVATLFPLARWYERLVVPFTHATRSKARLLASRILFLVAAVGYVAGILYGFDRDVVFSGKAELKQFYLATMLVSWIDWLVVERLGWVRPGPPQ